jgi:hypothetical protein
MVPTVVTLGDTTKPNPFTILILANVAMEAPWTSGLVTRDPILSKRPAFESCVGYVVNALTQGLPGCREPLLNDATVRGRVRILSLFDPTLSVTLSNSFVGMHSASSLLVARRAEIAAFIAAQGILADIVYAITDGDDLHKRASAWFTTDDPAGGGVAFKVDGSTFQHCFESSIPGTIAMHVAATGPTAAHEFCHAVSSYQNGSIVDLYVDSPHAVNNKIGRPIPPAFGTLDLKSHSSDLTRDHIGYPIDWKSYHSELIDSSRPALMDNYHFAADPLGCQNDGVTRQFIIERLRAKAARP